MIKFAIGYQYSEERPFFTIAESYKNSIDEVYYAWIDSPSGRSVIGGYDGYFDYGLQKNLMLDLRKIKAMGIKTDLLFNANCYGADSISRVMEGRVCSVIDYLESEGIKPDVITTTSPAVACIVKEHYSSVEVKASVNMKISTVKGMQYVSHLFDSFCVAKECNRDLIKLGELKNWADANNKKITILANSGCMRDCSGQIFHDNMVAHEAEISCRKNIDFLPYMCWNYLKDKNNFVSVLQNT